jgi:3-oxoacyl-[acyl-carrier protein] reductase
MTSTPEPASPPASKASRTRSTRASPSPNSSCADCTAADYLGRDNILVNSVCPSRISSPLADRLDLTGEILLGRSLEQQESQWGAEVPLGRWGVPDDIANAVAFVASDRAGFIVGSNIDVDGGYQRSIF